MTDEVRLGLTGSFLPGVSLLFGALFSYTISLLVSVDGGRVNSHYGCHALQRLVLSCISERRPVCCCPQWLFLSFCFLAMKTSTPHPRFRSTIVHRWLFFSLIVLLAVMYPLAVLRPLVVSRARRRKVNRQIRIEEVVNAEVSALSALVLHLEDYFR